MLLLIALGFCLSFTVPIIFYWIERRQLFYLPYCLHILFFSAFIFFTGCKYSVIACPENPFIENNILWIRRFLGFSSFSYQLFLIMFLLNFWKDKVTLNWMYVYLFLSFFSQVLIGKLPSILGYIPDMDLAIFIACTFLLAFVSVITYRMILKGNNIIQKLAIINAFTAIVTYLTIININWDIGLTVLNYPYTFSVVGTILELTGFNFLLNRKHHSELEMFRFNEVIFRNKLLELEKSALAAQMNPHFIFNCLNSIQHFIMKNDKESAMDYLGTFASLIRGSLRSSAESTISVAAEIKMLDNYLALEQLRLDHSFEYAITTDKTFDTFQTFIPPMLIQPFVENAVIHGMKDKKDGGKITIDFSKKSEHLHVSIQDNGCRQESRNSEHKSYGTSITQKRLAIINDLSESDIKVAPQYTEVGTIIRLKIKVQEPELPPKRPLRN